jgi:hypothetical protein
VVPSIFNFILITLLLISSVCSASVLAEESKTDALSRLSRLAWSHFQCAMLYEVVRDPKQRYHEKQGHHLGINFLETAINGGLKQEEWKKHADRHVQLLRRTN